MFTMSKHIQFCILFEASFKIPTFRRPVSKTANIGRIGDLQAFSAANSSVRTEVANSAQHKRAIWACIYNPYSSYKYHSDIMFAPNLTTLHSSESEKSYKCAVPGCKSTFPRPSALIRHEKDVHGFGPRRNFSSRMQRSWPGTDFKPTREELEVAKVDYSLEQAPVVVGTSSDEGGEIVLPSRMRSTHGRHTAAGR